MEDKSIYICEDISCMFCEFTYKVSCMQQPRHTILNNQRQIFILDVHCMHEQLFCKTHLLYNRKGSCSSERKTTNPPYVY